MVTCRLLPFSSLASTFVRAMDNSSSQIQMIEEYMTHLETLVELLHVNNQSQKSTDIISKGREAFDNALKALPDETVPHAHALYAKICVKVGIHDKAMDLFDEAIRRANAQTVDQSTREEKESLVKQLTLERSRSHNLFIESRVLQWHDANQNGYNGGIPKETSPWDPLSNV